MSGEVEHPASELIVAGQLLARPAESVPMAWAMLAPEDWSDSRCEAVFSAAVALWDAAGGVLVPEATEAYLDYMAHACAERLRCSVQEGYAVVDYLLREGECFKHAGRSCLADHLRWALSESHIRRLRSAIFAEGERAAGWAADWRVPFSGSLLGDAVHVGTGMVALGTALLDAVTLAGEVEAPRQDSRLSEAGRW